MTTPVKHNIQPDNHSIEEGDLVDNVRILSDLTRRDIQKSYNIESTQGTEAYYSNRYGWTLRRIVD